MDHLIILLYFKKGVYYVGIKLYSKLQYELIESLPMNREKF